MESEWLDIACINHEKYIMHGQIDNGVVDGICQTVQIEQVLTPEQKKEVDDLFFKHEREMRKLLRSLVV
jgi:Spy/CpxP family protein refolding chaperone